MTMTTRMPTTIAECGCPYDPEYDEGSLGWHLPENHPEHFCFKPLLTPLGTIRQPTADECRLVGRETSYSEPFISKTRYRDYRELGDYVIEYTQYDDDDKEYPERLELLYQLCDEFCIGDEVHRLPGVGVYVEE